MPKTDLLAKYRGKRDFSITPEPLSAPSDGEGHSFVIQKHWASHLHYDFRLELDGTMKSWAIPKGPSFDPKDKRMAIHVEDHPISYSSFEGEIPKKQYGAGKVIIWDKGTWTPVGDAQEGYRAGNLKFELHGYKLKGKWVLVRMKGKGEKQEPWLLIKEKDGLARSSVDFSVVDEMPDKVVHQLEFEITPAVVFPSPSGRGQGEGLSKISPAGLGLRGPHPALPADLSRRKRQAKAALYAVAVSNWCTIPDSVASLKTPRSNGAEKIPKRVQAKVALPQLLSPQLATLADKAPSDPDKWIFEIKFDGYRMLCRIDGAAIKFVTRNGNDWTSKLTHLQSEVAKLKLPPGWYDGEIVLPNARGLPDFGALQQAFDSAKTKEVVLYLFDALFIDGRDLRKLPLIDRRSQLEALLRSRSSRHVLFSEEFIAPPHKLVLSACQLGLEGIIGKRRDSVYSSRRSEDWIKLKCSQRQEFVIGGYTDPQGSRAGIGALLLGVHDEAGDLIYAGKVGTGFDDRTLNLLKKKLAANAAPKSPFATTDAVEGKPHWVKPSLVAEVTFANWTRDNRIRHSVFHALRTDKPAKEIVREKVVSIQPSKAPRSSSAGDDSLFSSAFRISHPERVIDASTGLTKLEVVRYYGLVGDLMMEHLKNRPVSLVRAPAGVKGSLFFQKHAETEKLIGVETLDPKLDLDHAPMLAIATKRGLLSAAQWNVIEFHTRNGVANTFNTPDRLVFDLDPGEGVRWSEVQEAAQIVHQFLDQLGLVAFLKTSGGKGLHVVVPIRRNHHWDAVKAFSKAVVVHLSKVVPQRFVAVSGPRNRVGKIFIDYLRNGEAATTVAAWSARARAGMGISVPVTWDELPKLRGGDHWTIKTADVRLDAGNSPWKEYRRSVRSLAPAMKLLLPVRG